MEYNWTLFNNSNGSSNYVRSGHGDNCVSNHAWDFITSSRPNTWTYPLHHNSFTYPPPAAAADSSVGAFHALMLQDQQKSAAAATTTTTSSSLHSFNPDPHLTCLKLGKRHYFEDVTPPVVVGPFSVAKKGKPYAGESDGGLPAAVPRCQVEGCEAALVNAKEYHRRHKVCEMHAKAPKVVVLGIHQRFCQQCSRFHAVSEFDEAKRSCRRRLAGHNERRRKSSQEQTSFARKHSHQEIKMVGVGRQTQVVNNSECALSLLSSTQYTPWNISTSPDLPARCSAALRELIAENRASLSARAGLGPQESGGHVTLNLMQAPNSAFGLLSVHDHKSSKEDHGQDCSQLWKLPLGY